MPRAARSGRAGFPTVRVSLVALLVVQSSVSPARAALSPAPVRLALMFEREVWSRTEPMALRLTPHRSVAWVPAQATGSAAYSAADPDVFLPIPVRPGTGPIPYEVP